MDQIINVWRALEAAAPYLLAVLMATTMLSHVLQSGAHALERWAKASKAKWDDKPASFVAKAADALVLGCDFITRLLPRVTLAARQIDAVLPKDPKAPAEVPPNPYPPAGAA